ncbi:carbohydrate ABC transporter permease [Hamadaea tsunoensis]|uniref:carbohydrate ABC transporter permease n=1 Tax=Hamadaea tsunoensis TaxID=53368 RepID=UPI0004208023|nr:sugar ABC transporter permease [Hamadaea tsunoensis]
MSSITLTGDRVRPVLRRGSRHRSWRSRLVVLSFMAPALIGLAVFLGYPLAAAVYFSFTRFSLLNPPEFVGLDNWKYLFSDPLVGQAAYNTLWLTVVMVPARMLAALLTAMLLNAMKRARGLYRVLFYLPALAPPVTSTIAFVLLLKPQTGPVDAFLRTLGIDGPRWFNDPAWAKPALVLLALWGVGDLMIIFVAALLDVPVEQHEAAALDGANAFQRFRYVTLPAINPVIVFAAITGVIGTLQYFTQAAVAASVASNQVTGGGGVSGTFGYPENSMLTYPMWLYTEGFRYNLFGYANVMAVVLFVVSMTVTVVLLKRFRTFIGGDR